MFGRFRLRISTTREEVPMEMAREEGSLRELVGRLSQDMTLLVRQEVQLARVELGGILARAIRDSVSLAGAGLVGYIGALALVAGIVLVLVQVAGVPAWLAALLVGAVLGVIGIGMVLAAVRDLRRLGPPHRTVKTIRDDVQWVKEQP
jgi:uncharacterized membrane protein YqjE